MRAEAPKPSDERADHAAEKKSPARIIPGDPAGIDIR